jgi:hypothetical protein
MVEIGFANSRLAERDHSAIKKSVPPDVVALRLSVAHGGWNRHSLMVVI